MTYRTAAINSASFSTSSPKSRNSRKSTNNRGSQKHNQHYNPRQQGLGAVSNFIVVAVMIGLIGLLYLTQITKSTTYSYRIQNLEEEYSSKLKENQSLKIESARLQSLDRLEDSAYAKNLVTTDATNTTFGQ